jgi:DNA-directed RNA polymerase subunit RPC12/RpoP
MRPYLARDRRSRTADFEHFQIAMTSSAARYPARVHQIKSAHLGHVGGISLARQLAMRTSHLDDSLKTLQDASSSDALLTPDRRVHRTPNPPCTLCEGVMLVIDRTTKAVAYRCTECSLVRMMPIPGRRLRCPRCGSEHVRRSHRRLWERPRTWLTGQLPVLCYLCNWSGWS